MLAGNIKQIVFDFGGVLLPINPQRTIQAFRDLGVERIERYYTLENQHRLFDRLETGQLSPDEFFFALEGEGMDLPHELMEEAWNKLLLPFPKEKFVDLQALREKYPLYLLSNTNLIHYRYYSAAFEEKYDESLRGQFVKAYFSHEIGMRKPGAEIFTYVLTDSNLKAEETLFVDDNAANVAAAKSVGMQAIQWEHNSKASLLSLFAGV